MQERNDAPLPDDDQRRCPECGARLYLKMSGVACTRCTWWFCY